MFSRLHVTLSVNGDSNRVKFANGHGFTMFNVKVIDADLEAALPIILISYYPSGTVSISLASRSNCPVSFTNVEEEDPSVKVHKSDLGPLTTSQEYTIGPHSSTRSV